MTVRPTQIKKTEEGGLRITWSDGISRAFTLAELRDACPCAGCKGETILFRTYIPERKPDLPGKYDLKGIEQIGTYAVKMTWGDGHDTGIYSFELLRRLTEE
jgi:DUF971 family protein